MQTSPKSSASRSEQLRALPLAKRLETGNYSRQRRDGDFWHWWRPSSIERLDESRRGGSHPAGTLTGWLEAVPIEGRGFRQICSAKAARAFESLGNA